VRAFERSSFWVTSIIELILIAVIIWAAIDLSTPMMALIAGFLGYLLVRDISGNAERMRLMWPPTPSTTLGRVKTPVATMIRASRTSPA
jgi:membrane-bound metal-dependent hydrolase YbcI (DUF457 family)